MINDLLMSFFSYHDGELLRCFVVQFTVIFIVLEMNISVSNNIFYDRMAFQSKIITANYFLVRRWHEIIRSWGHNEESLIKFCIMKSAKPG